MTVHITHCTSVGPQKTQSRTLKFSYTLAHCKNIFLVEPSLPTVWELEWIHDLESTVGCCAGMELQPYVHCYLQLPCATCRCCKSECDVTPVQVSLLDMQGSWINAHKDGAPSQPFGTGQHILNGCLAQEFWSCVRERLSPRKMELGKIPKIVWLTGVFWPPNAQWLSG